MQKRLRWTSVSPCRESERAGDGRTALHRPVRRGIARRLIAGTILALELIREHRKQSTLGVARAVQPLDVPPFAPVRPRRRVVDNQQS